MRGGPGPVVVPTGPEGLNPSAAEGLAAHLRSGGLVIYPTETLYGLGAMVEAGATGSHGAGLARVLDLKGRDPSRPVALLVPDGPRPGGLELNAVSEILARRFWPGPLTLVLDDPDRLYPPGIRSAEGGVGMRVSSGPVAAAMVSALGRPVTATSANRSGEAPATDLQSAIGVARHLEEAASRRGPGGEPGIWVVDGGALPPSLPSSVVDCRAGIPRILREGAVPEAEIRAALAGSGLADGVGPESEAGEEPFRLVFVCSGNTCRSPLAAALARRYLGSVGLNRPVEVFSAGTGAWPGSPASEGSAAAAARHGLDLTGHRAASLDEALVRDADLILAMSPHHLAAAERFGGKGKAHLLSAFARGGQDPLDGDPIRDPFGGGDEVYEATYRELEDLVDQAVRRIIESGSDRPRGMPEP